MLRYSYLNHGIFPPDRYYRARAPMRINLCEIESKSLVYWLFTMNYYYSIFTFRQTDRDTVAYYYYDRWYYWRRDELCGWPVSASVTTTLPFVVISYPLTDWLTAGQLTSSKPGDLMVTVRQVEMPLLLVTQSSPSPPQSITCKSPGERWDRNKSRRRERS